MNTLEELSKADRNVKDMEIRLRTMQTAIDAIDREIADFALIEANLEENIRYLKKKGAIALAAEFKKSKQDLLKTKNRLRDIRLDKNKAQKAYDEIEKILNNAKSEYNYIKKQLDTKIVRGNFGRKKDG